MLASISLILLQSFLFVCITHGALPSELCAYLNGNCSIQIDNNFEYDSLTISLWLNSENIRVNIQAIWSNRIPGCNEVPNLDDCPSPGIALFMNEWRTDNRQLLLESFNHTDQGYGCATSRSALSVVPRLKWFHLVMTSQRGGDTQLYLNGRALPLQLTTLGPQLRDGRSIFNYSTIGEFIPSFVMGRQSYGFEGMMDEVTFWSKVFPPSSIPSLATDPVDLTDPTLEGYFTFDTNAIRDISPKKVMARNNGRSPIQYHLVELGETCGNGLVEPAFGEECDSGLGCTTSCQCQPRSDYVPYDPPRLDCAPSGMLSWGVAVAAVAVPSVCVVPVLFVLVFFLLNRDEKPFLGATPVFCLLTLVGSVMLVLSPVTMAQGVGTAHNCTAEVWLWGCGFILLFGSLVVKTWRIERLYHVDFTKKVVISDLDLLMYFAFLFALELAILIPWTLVAPLSAVESYGLTAGGDATMMLGCIPAPGAPLMPFLGTQLAYAGVLLVAGCVLALRVRNVPLANVREGMEILFAVYNFAILLVIVGAVVGSVPSINAQVVLVLVGLEIATLLSTLSLFSSKVYKVMLGKDLWKLTSSASRAVSLSTAE